MKLKELLLNGLSFNELLKQFAMSSEDVTIKDEALIPINQSEFIKERVCIQGKNAGGIVNLFGILHCNLLNQLAVFELDFAEKGTNITA